ncbi:hypothetical protein BH11PSE11_BH11PSE11_16860 [soil metagenome]
MKTKLKMLLALLGLVMSSSYAEAEPTWPQKKATQSTMTMRDKLLAAKSNTFGIKTENDEQVWAVIMDQGFDGGSLSLIALQDGNASVYLSSGGGVIGGIAHPTVVAAAKNIVMSVNSMAGKFKHVKTFPLPSANQINFYAISNSGVKSATDSESALIEGTHPLNSVFYKGHYLLSELRKISESRP